jgi:purine-nucleoside phosphorylase
LRAVRLETHVDIGREAGLALGRLEEVPVAVVRSGSTPTLPVRVARLLGAEVLVLTRQVHALTSGATAGQLGVIEDHIGLLVPNPLIGPNPDEIGTRFPDMSEAYDPALRALAQGEAERSGGTLTAGVYAAHPDPNVATPAEYRMLRTLGADWVGKGGVPEALVARHAGMRVLGLVGSAGSEQRLAELVGAVVARLGAGT